MRHPLLVLLLCTAVAARAEEAGRSLKDRIEHPDMAKSFEVTKGSPSANRSIRSRGANTKDFVTAPFSAKAFSAKEFSSSKSAYVGKSTVPIREASINSGREIPKATAAGVPVMRAVAVDNARDAGKTVDTRTAASADRPFLVRGRSQDRLDIEKGTPMTTKPLGYSGNFKTLSLEDIRELLNKNK